MINKLIDSHTHLQFSAYNEDREEVIQRALDNNIWIINSGSNTINSKEAIDLALRYERGVYATLGIHPSHAGKEEKEITEDGGFEQFNFSLMHQLALNEKVVAIGECGYDFFRIDKKEFEDSQREVFVSQIQLANLVSKPLVIHCRDAYEETYRTLFDNKNLLLSDRVGIMHFYSGDKGYAKKFLDLGFSFTFGGAVTLPKKQGSADFEELIKYLPKNKIMLETDAPYVSPLKYRGRRNESFYILEVLKAVALILGVREEEVADFTTNNTSSLFKI